MMLLWRSVLVCSICLLQTVVGRIMDKNVLGTGLELCCDEPVTGFYRNGRCETGPQDYGRHVVCAHVTTDFLEFTRARGNDLSTPNPQYGFPGLRDGDCWCLCAVRWKEALQAGRAPPVKLAATHESALNYVQLEDLRQHALDVTMAPCPNQTMSDSR